MSPPPPPTLLHSFNSFFFLFPFRLSCLLSFFSFIPPLYFFISSSYPISIFLFRFFPFVFSAHHFSICFIRSFLIGLFIILFADIIITADKSVIIIPSFLSVGFLLFLFTEEVHWHDYGRRFCDEFSLLLPQTVDESSVPALTRGKPRDGRRVSYTLQTRPAGVLERVPSPRAGQLDRAHQRARPVGNQVIQTSAPLTPRTRPRVLIDSSFLFCRIYLIGSTPGRFQGSNMEKWGHLKLRKVCEHGHHQAVHIF